MFLTSGREHTHRHTLNTAARVVSVTGGKREDQRTVGTSPEVGLDRCGWRDVRTTGHGTQSLTYTNTTTLYTTVHYSLWPQ